MAVRLISCRNCGHMVRLGVMRCGRCDATTPLMNWSVIHVALFGMVIVLVLGLLALPNAG